MKMSELRLENESLKQQIQLLSQQQKEGEKDSATITQLKEKNRSLKKSVKDLKAEKTLLSGKVQTLETDKSSQEQAHQELKAEFDRIKQQSSELSGLHSQTVSEVESLRVDKKALQEKASQLPGLQAELKRLQQVENICSERTAQVASLQAELEQRGQLLDQARASAAKDATEHQDQIVKLNSEMEAARDKHNAELEDLRYQSGSLIASLQAQNEGFSTKITELTEKLKLVATHLERQLSEKKKIAYQYETSAKEHQAYRDSAEKQIKDLMALLQKMASELDASRSAHLLKDTQPVKVDGGKPGSQADDSTPGTQAQFGVRELQDQLAVLNNTNSSQARELAALSARMKRLNRALATPLGRLVSPLLGLKD